MCSECRRIAMRGSAFCWAHDSTHKKLRGKIAIASNDPRRITKAFQRKHRATMQKLWRRNPWFNASTIWFHPQIELQFQRACINLGLPLEIISPRMTDDLRWKWKLHQFDTRDAARWDIAVVKARRRGRLDGSPPLDWDYQPPGSSPPGVASPVVVITQRARVHWRSDPHRLSAKVRRVAAGGAGESRAAAKAKATAESRAAEVDAFLGKHHRDLREVLRRLGAGADDPQIRARLADAYAGQLRGEHAGHVAFHQLLREADASGARWR
jgi:hypothetical protein